MKVFIYTLLLFFFILPIEATHCPILYRSRDEYSLKVEDEKVYLVIKSRESNGSTLSGYRKLLLPISAKGAELVAFTYDNNILIANDEYYYLLPTYSFEKILQIYPKAKVTAFVGNQTFKINGKWKRMTCHVSSKTFKEVNVPDLPTSLAQIKRMNSFSHILGNQCVYLYDERDIVVKKLADLNAQNIHHFDIENLQTQHFLFNKDTFYRFSVWWASKTSDNDIKNITENLRKQGFKGDFTTAKIQYIDKKERFISFEDKNTPYLWYFGGEIGTIHKNYRYSEEYNLVLNDKNQFFDRYGDFRRINEESVRDINQLKYFKGSEIYYDGFQFYACSDYDFIPIHLNTLSARIAMQKEYQNYGKYTRLGHKLRCPFVILDKNIIYYKERTYKYFSKSYKNNKFDKYEIQKRAPIDSDNIKDLKYCFATLQKFLIEDKIIDNIADFDTLEYIGSTSQEENNKGNFYYTYHYFFKDKNNVYVFHSNKQNMEKLPISASSFDENIMCEYFFKDNIHNYTKLSKL